MSGSFQVVDLDLEKFFDRVNHDVLMGKLAKRLDDRRVLRLTRRYLQAGIGPWLAWGTADDGPGPWRAAARPALTQAPNNMRFTPLGYHRLHERYLALAVA